MSNPEALRHIELDELQWIEKLTTSFLLIVELGTITIRLSRGSNACRPQADLHHISPGVDGLDEYSIAHSEWSIGQDQHAGDRVGNRVLRGERKPQSSDPQGGGERGDVDAKAIESNSQRGDDYRWCMPAA